MRPLPFPPPPPSPPPTPPLPARLHSLPNRAIRPSPPPHRLSPWAAGPAGAPSRGALRPPRHSSGRAGGADQQVGVRAIKRGKEGGVPVALFLQLCSLRKRAARFNCPFAGTTPTSSPCRRGWPASTGLPAACTASLTAHPRYFLVTLDRSLVMGGVGTHFLRTRHLDIALRISGFNACGPRQAPLSS